MADFSSEVQFDLARRAIERGWVSREQVEEAILRCERDPTVRLLDRLSLTPGQRRELERPGRSLPPEVAEAMRDPSHRVGRYWRVAHLKSGGMGSVFRAWDEDLGRWVALKFLRRFEDERARAFFQREARLAASLEHPNIAKIYEIGEHEGQPYIAMQLVDGETLADARLKSDAKVEAAVHVAEALRYAHGRGVIHRDLKPANVMIDRQGQVYVMDFGLAKENDVEGESLTGTQAVVGTPSYMAPEQARGKAEARSDLYGLGATMYELFTGRPPFVGESSADILMQVLTCEPLWPRRLAPGIPADLEAILLKALEREPGRRYATAEQMREDLEAYRKNEPLRHARRPTWGYVLSRRIRKQPLLWGLGSAFVVALAGGASFGAWTLVQRNRALEAQLRAERNAEAVRKVEDAYRKYQAGLTEDALRDARSAQSLRPDLPGGWYWEARCLLREYARHPRLPTPWIADGSVEFLPAPSEPAVARALRERATALVERAGSLAAQGLEGWEIPGALGIVSVLQGRFEEGGRRLEEALRNPGAQWDAEAHYYLALSRYFRRRFAEADDRHLVRTAEGTELLARTLQGAALREELSGRSREALRLHDRALAVATMHPDPDRRRILQSAVLVLRAELRHRIGRSEDAREDGRTALKLGEAPGRDAAYARGEAAIALARFREERGAKTEAIGLARQAIDEFGRALEADPECTAARIRRGFARETLSRFLTSAELRRQAAEDYGEAMRAAPGPQVRLALHRVRDFRSTAESLADLEAMEREFGKGDPLRVQRARTLAAHAQFVWETEKRDPVALYERAVRECDEALRANAEYAEAGLARGHVHASWGDYVMIHGGDPTPLYEKVFADVESTLRVNPEYFEALRLKASKHLSLGIYRGRHGRDPVREWNAAVEDQSRALSINPESVQTYCDRALVRMNLGLYLHAAGKEGAEEQFDLGLRDCEEASRLLTGSGFVAERGMILIWKGMTQLAQGRKEEARLNLEAGIREMSRGLGGAPEGFQSVSYGQQFALRGRAFCALGRHAEAREDFERSAKYGWAEGRTLLEQCRPH